ncbi:hypothetical protein [Streptomyces sp. NPDC101166]|uniref:hypothetical protein n=1 Tax=Streptomyces sp. NPDC101166 TaxID=3366120 RepID=UPI0038190199
MKKVVAAAALSVVLAVGCSNSADDTEDAKSAAERNAVSPTSEPEVVDAAPDPVAGPDPITLDEIDCSGLTYATVEEAWTAGADQCEATLSGTEMSESEAKAVTTAYGAPTEGDVEKLAVLYGMCAQSGPSAFGYLESAGSPEQLAEVRGALLVCPSHPDKSKLRALVGGAERKNKLESEGRVFGDGVYRVGNEVKPGTYYSTDVEGCYWERTDASGEIIDNSYVIGAKRIQVTIRAGDHSFNSTNCGEWQPVGS